MKKTGKALMWIFFGWIVIDLNYLSIFHPTYKYEGYSTETIIGIMITPITWLLFFTAIIGFLLYSIGDRREKKYKWIIGIQIGDEGRILNVSKEHYGVYSIWKHGFRWEHKNPKEVVRKLEEMNYRRVSKYAGYFEKK